MRTNPHENMSRMTITERLESLKQQQEDLHKQLVAELAVLHKRYGFPTRQEFISFLQAITEAEQSASESPAPEAKSPRARTRTRRKGRTSITAEMRRSVEQMIRAGITDIAIAEQLGISRPSVQNIKRAAGLTRKKSGKTTPVRSPRKTRSKPAATESTPQGSEHPASSPEESVAATPSPAQPAA